MKKLLLACASVALGFGFATADTVTFDFKTNDYGLSERGGSAFDKEGTINDGDITITLATESGSGFRLWSDGLRVYKGKATMDIACSNGVINSISVTAAKATVMGFTSTPSSTKNVEWTAGDAESVMLYFAPTANNAVETIVVDYTPGATDLEPAELSFPQAEYKVQYPNGTFTAPELTKATDAVAVYSSSNEDVATVAEDGTVTIVAPGTTVITATCDATDKYAKGSAKYTLVVYKAAQSIADMLNFAAADKNAEFMVEFPMTVTYANDRYVYVKDADNAYTLIYFASGTDAYAEGDVLAAGWMVKYSEYQTLPEFAPIDTPTVSGKEEVEFRTVTLASIEEEMVNEIVCIDHVVLTEATPATRSAFNVAYDGGSMTFYNQFTLEAQAAGTYKVKAAVSMNKNNVQVYPIAYDLSTGVTAVEAAEGEATYFDLNGRQVENPANGIYVKVANGKTSKVVVR